MFLDSDLFVTDLNFLSLSEQSPTCQSGSLITKTRAMKKKNKRRALKQVVGD